MNILIVDDEEPIRELINYNIGKVGFKTFTKADGQSALISARNDNIDLIILDLMLPDMSGLDICRILKNDSSTKNIPIIMVTAKTEDNDIVTGLELGADDYVTKPFSPKVLIARVQSVLRRKNSLPENIICDEIVIHGIKISITRHEVFKNNNSINLSATEFSILEFLAKHPGQVFSRQQIISAVKGSSYPATDRSIDVQILGIRRKLGDSSDNGNPIIETLRGVGYRLTEE